METKMSRSDMVDEKVNKRRYIIASICCDLAIGISGFVIMGIAFMLAVSSASRQTINGRVYMAIALSLLLVFLINYFINKIVYFYFNHFNTIPGIWMLISNIFAWLVLVIVYIVMSLL